MTNFEGLRCVYMNANDTAISVPIKLKLKYRDAHMLGISC